MPQLQAIESASFGGVDSRSNPVVMPPNRFLRVTNWWPKQDGHLELRDGYTRIAMVPTVSPIHSPIPYQDAFGGTFILYWYGTSPRVMNLSTLVVTTPTVRGAAIASSARWAYALGRSGFLYAHNATDKKFFDGLVWRDMGLPQLTAGQLAGAAVATPGGTGVAASTVGGAQPGYLFWAAIYNSLTGHVGNGRVFGSRVAPGVQFSPTITGLPDLSGIDTEWKILIGRTDDGGVTAHLIEDSGGNWISVPNGSTSIVITAGAIDGNAEMPINNGVPPAFVLLWREGGRICGNVRYTPTVNRSGSELDAQSGIFVGDPGQSWAPKDIETFPTAQNCYAGFAYNQESWVFTANDLAILSELSGELAWNGPWNGGVASRFAFTQAWKNLPFWLSHEKQLCTMVDNTGPIPISGEYESALLAKIGDQYLEAAELLYFRDAEKQLEILRIKARDASGTPFTIIHDFNLRDVRSPYGQGYEEDFNGPLATDFTQLYMRDAAGKSQIWAGASDGYFYQLYSGGDDNGAPFTADLVGLLYVGPRNTAIKSIEWYGDQNTEWFISDKLDQAPDPELMVEASADGGPVPGEEHNSHWIIDIASPEMTHCYVWVSLVSHPADALSPTSPKALNNPPHFPVEIYGRILLTQPIVGGSRGT